MTGQSSGIPSDVLAHREAGERLKCGINTPFAVAAGRKLPQWPSRRCYNGGRAGQQRMASRRKACTHKNGAFQDLSVPAEVSSTAHPAACTPGRNRAAEQQAAHFVVV